MRDKTEEEIKNIIQGNSSWLRHAFPDWKDPVHGIKTITHPDIYHRENSARQREILQASSKREKKFSCTR